MNRIIEYPKKNPVESTNGLSQAYSLPGIKAHPFTWGAVPVSGHYLTGVNILPFAEYFPGYLPQALLSQAGGLWGWGKNMEILRLRLCGKTPHGFAQALC